MANTSRAEIRTAIHQRIRRKVKGGTEKPRLAIYRSLNHIYAQVIDDHKGETIVSASSTEKDLRGNTGGNQGGNSGGNTGGNQGGNTGGNNGGQGQDSPKPDNTKKP